MKFANRINKKCEKVIGSQKGKKNSKSHNNGNSAVCIFYSQ